MHECRIINRHFLPSHHPTGIYTVSEKMRACPRRIIIRFCLSAQRQGRLFLGGHRKGRIHLSNGAACCHHHWQDLYPRCFSASTAAGRQHNHGINKEEETSKKKENVRLVAKQIRADHGGTKTTVYYYDTNSVYQKVEPPKDKFSFRVRKRLLSPPLAPACLALSI